MAGGWRGRAPKGTPARGGLGEEVGGEDGLICEGGGGGSSGGGPLGCDGRGKGRVALTGERG